MTGVVFMKCMYLWNAVCKTWRSRSLVRGGVWPYVRFFATFMIFFPNTELVLTQTELMVYNVFLRKNTQIKQYTTQIIFFYTKNCFLFKKIPRKDFCLTGDYFAKLNSFRVTSDTETSGGSIPISQPQRRFFRFWIFRKNRLWQGVVFVNNRDNSVPQCVASDKTVVRCPTFRHCRNPPAHTHPYLPAFSIRAYTPFSFGDSLHPTGQTLDYPANPSVDDFASR